MSYHEDTPSFLKPNSAVKTTDQANEKLDREFVFELVDSSPRESFNISLELLGGGLGAIESALSRSQIKHLSSLNIQTSRDWQRDIEVDLRLIFVDGSDVKTLRNLKCEPPLECGPQRVCPVTILLLINADKAAPEILPVSRECIVNTQIHFKGSEEVIHEQVDQFYRFLLSAVEFDHRLVCIDWADIRCVLLLSRRLEFRALYPHNSDSLASSAGQLIGGFCQQSLQQSKSLLFYVHSALFHMDMEDFFDVSEYVCRAVSEDCCSLSSMGFQLPEDGSGVAGVLLGLP